MSWNDPRPNEEILLKSVSLSQISSTSLCAPHAKRLGLLREAATLHAKLGGMLCGIEAAPGATPVDSVVGHGDVASSALSGPQDPDPSHPSP